MYNDIHHLTVGIMEPRQIMIRTFPSMNAILFNEVPYDLPCLRVPCQGPSCTYLGAHPGIVTNRYVQRDQLKS